MRSDIALSSAIIAIDNQRKDVSVIAFPDLPRQRDRYSHVFGACDPYWSECSRDALRGELLMQIWHAVTFLDVPPAAVHEALLVVPEYREIMLAESLPREYRQ